MRLKDRDFLEDVLRDLENDKSANTADLRRCMVILLRESIDTFDDERLKDRDHGKLEPAEFRPPSEEQVREIVEAE